MAWIKSKRVTLYVVENQQGVYGDINSLTFPDTAPVALLGVSTCSEVAEIERAASLCPDVLLLLTRKLERNVIEALKQVREDNPSIGLVLLSTDYDADDIELLTRLTLIGEGGTALFLEQSLDPIEKLSGIVLAVSQGEIIFDPALLVALSADAPIYQLLRRLSAREVEILDLLSKGYTDSSIADTLDVDAKTVGQHISSMYGRLKVEASL